MLHCKSVMLKIASTECQAINFRVFLETKCWCAQPFYHTKSIITLRRYLLTTCTEHKNQYRPKNFHQTVPTTPQITALTSAIMNPILNTSGRSMYPAPKYTAACPLL